MADYGVTADGFTRKPYTVIQDEIQKYLRAKISNKLQLTEKTGLGNVVNSVSDQLAEAWEALEAGYNAFDPENALDAAFVALCELTGTLRRGASKGLVGTTCSFSGGVTYPPGALVAHVDGQPDNRWVNKSTVETLASGTYPVIFESEVAGSQAKALAGTLTRIAQPVSGWNSITNAADATPGADIESIEDLYVRREQELQAAGAGSMPAIRAAVSRVPGVIQVSTQENKTDYADVGFGLPPHSYRVIVWDGAVPAAENNEIAQAIYDAAPGAIPTIGAVSGTAVDADGLNVTINFDRATAVPIAVYLAVQGSAVGGAEAILTEIQKLGIGGSVPILKLLAVAGALPGVTNIFTINMGIGTNPYTVTGTSDVVMGPMQIPVSNLSQIAVVA